MAKFKPTAKLNFGEIEHYNPLYLQNNYTDAQVRKEYSRLRAIAQKRLVRLAKAGFDQSNIYRYNRYNVRKLSELRSKEVALALSQLAQFISNPLSTVTGQKQQRKEKIAKLQSYGYDVTEKNFQSFTEFMELVNEQAMDLGYDSEATVELWETIRDKVSPATVMQDIEQWIDNRYKLAEISDIKSYTADELLEVIRS